ncbi:MAG: O-antigen ligase family protein [Acidobacteriota bacterium]
MLTLPFLAALVSVFLLLMVTAPFYSLLLVDLGLMSIIEPWYIGGSLLDPTDVFIAFFGLMILVRGNFSLTKLITEIPYLIPWLALGTVLSLSYMASPENAENLTSAPRIAYQLYRYCWKGLLYYPICLIALRSLGDARVVFTGLILGANVCAAQAVLQGYAGDREPPGPFSTGNGLAAVLIVPIILSLSGVVFPASRLHWLFSGASLLLMARAVLFSASRGGMVSMMAAAGVLGAVTFLMTSGRRRIFKMVPLAIMAPIVLLLMRPDLLDRPTVKHAVTLTQGTSDGNMQWRIQQRWPHFIEIAMDNPWLGTGTYIDRSLSLKANTPHNGFIAWAVKYGLIAFALLLFFIYKALRDNFMAFRRSKLFHERIFYLTLVAATFGLITHNMVETTWPDTLILKFFWLIVALGASFHHVWEASDPESERQLRTAPAGGRPTFAPTRQPA